jgi:hypothetical protein
MFKRIALTLTFVAAFAAAGLSFNTPAQAWRYWGSPYSSYYYGPPRVYGGYYAPYRTYYYGGPMVTRGYYSTNYYGPATRPARCDRFLARRHPLIRPIQACDRADKKRRQPDGAFCLRR